MYIGKLTKISNNENALRTNDMEGSFEFPIVGSRFIIINDKPLDPTAGSNRMIYTSLVKEVKELKKDTYEVLTENSTYMIEIYEKVSET